MHHRRDNIVDYLTGRLVRLEGLDYGGGETNQGLSWASHTSRRTPAPGGC